MGQMQHDPGQFAVADQEVGAAAEKLVGDAVRRRSRSDKSGMRVVL